MFKTLYREKHPHGGQLPEGVTQTVTVKAVSVGCKVGSEVRIMSMDMATPGSECWFVVDVAYTTSVPIAKSYVKDWRNQEQDSDTLATNGDEYYVVRRSIGLSRLFITDEVHQLIMTHISQFAESFT
jgi:hypothetical protein